MMGPRYTARRRERSMRAVPDDGGDAPRTLRRSDMLGASACDDGRPVWTSLLPSAKMELAHNDSSRDILKLAPGALSAEDRRLVEDVASCASALAVPQPTQARSITPAADSQLARLLRNLTARLGGLPDGRRRFHCALECRRDGSRCVHKCSRWRQVPLWRPMPAPSRLSPARQVGKRSLPHILHASSRHRCNPGPYIHLSGFTATSGQETCDSRRFQTTWSPTKKDGGN